MCEWGVHVNERDHLCGGVCLRGVYVCLAGGINLMKPCFYFCDHQREDPPRKEVGSQV